MAEDDVGIRRVQSQSPVAGRQAGRQRQGRDAHNRPWDLPYLGIAIASWDRRCHDRPIVAGITSLARSPSASRARFVLNPSPEVVMTSNPRARDTARWAHHASRTSSSVCWSSWSLACPGHADASLLSPELEDKMADFLALLSSSSSRSAGSWSSGSCTSCRRGSRTSAITRSSRPSVRCACCRWCSAACCGGSPGSGPTPSRPATRWRTAPTSIRTTTRTRRSTSARRSRSCNSVRPRSSSAGHRPASSSRCGPSGGAGVADHRKPFSGRGQ